MTAAAAQSNAVPPSLAEAQRALLSTECARIELLAECVGQLRQGVRLQEATLERLRALQCTVDENRRDNLLWRKVVAAPLTAIEYDVLACAVAPEIEPRIGWHFQQIQASPGQPYPTLALVHELLVLESHETPMLAVALSEDAPLRRRGLVEVDGKGSFAPLRPGHGIASKLLGIPEPELVLPGALRVDADASWEELVLPPDRMASLREFLLWVRHRSTVVDEWGGRRVGGPVAMFSGPSGTGKTFAAAVIARELDWPLYRVDLGAIVSKYIGETEKNLNKLFDSAHGRPMVLQFDEADALFGKRGEVKDARDRYANMEVSHLLARIEKHEGPCILTTNLRGHLDVAFSRRFQIVVEFPRPDAKARAELWRILLPPRAPRTAEVDPELLGASVSLTGGGIRNAALHAAYLAAGHGGPIRLEEIALAAWRELCKERHEAAPEDLGALRRYLEERP